MSDDPAAAASDVVTTRRSFVLFACLIATFASAVESTIVATAMPSIVAQLGDFSLFAWVFSIYMVSQAASIPLFGRLADNYGRKRAFCIGTGLFLLGSALCGLASSMTLLVAFRALQGIGAGGLQPIANTIVGDIYSSAERARMHGLMSSVYCISAVVGPSLGSVLVQYGSWPIIFWLNLPIGIAAIALMILYLPETAQRRPLAVDYLGSTLLMLAVGAPLVAIRAVVLNLMHGHRIGSGLPLGAAAIGAAALLALVMHERRRPKPLLPIELWHNRIIAVGCLGGGVAGAMMMGTAAFLPTYVQGVMGRSASVAGFVLGVMSILWTLASIGAGAILMRTSYRFTAAVGTLLLLAGAIALITMTPDSGPVWATAGAGLIGIGMGLCTTTFIVSIQSAVPWQQRGAATSSVMFLRCLGQGLGVAIFGSTVNLSMVTLDPTAAPVINQLLHPNLRAPLSPEVLARLTDVMAQSLHNAFLLAGILAAIALALSLYLPSKLSPVNEPAPG